MSPLTKIPLLLLLAGTGFFFIPSDALGEGPAPTQERKSYLRESEILGTLEKPKMSTTLPWKDPERLNVNESQPHRSFLREIFRQVSPPSRPDPKKDLKEESR